MIGIRASLLGLVAAVVAGATFAGIGEPDPSWRLAAAQRIVDAARAADAELAPLEAALERAVETARLGATRVVGGEEAPGPRLLESVEHATTAEEHARRAADRLAALDAARRTVDPGVVALEPPTRRGEMASIAVQLEATADAGDEFARMRHRAEEVVAALDRSLAALGAGEIAHARRDVEASRSALDEVAAWEVGLPSLPVWIATAGAMITAVEMLVAATEDGDAERAARAAEAFADASSESAVGDRALRIAMSEGGSGVAAPALGRLATALAATRQTRAEVATILQAAGR